VIQIEKKEIRFIDLFGGVGGFRLGLERAEEVWNRRQDVQEWGESDTPRGKFQQESPARSNSSCSYRCVAYYEIDKFAVQTYNKNFGEQHEPKDIRSVKSADVPDHDLLCAGFPCQSFSVAGKRRGFDDTRGTLFFEIARIARDKRPKNLLLENVKGLLSHDEGATFGTILQTLDELGYDAEWQVLNSKDWGVPQNRERVFIIGHLRGQSRFQVFPIWGSSGQDIKIEGFLNEGGWEKRNESIRRVYGTGGVCSSLSTGTTRIRRLTPIECERLQGFPDDWTKYGVDEKGETISISDTQRYKMMGNAVSVPVIEVIGERMLEVLG